jgi:Na+/proline symporter
MTPRIVLYLVIGMWLIVTGIVLGYPLCAGRIRVGLDPVSRDTAPKAFWTAYVISTLLFIAVSFAVGFFIRAILPPRGP